MQATCGGIRREQKIPHAVLRQRLVDQPVNLVTVGGDEAHHLVPVERGRAGGLDGFGVGHGEL